MSNIDIATPVSSAPSDRLALGVGWVRPGVAGIGGTLNPSWGVGWDGTALRVMKSSTVPYR